MAPGTSAARAGKASGPRPKLLAPASFRGTLRLFRVGHDGSEPVEVLTLPIARLDLVRLDPKFGLAV